MLSQTDGATMVGSQYVLYPSHGGLASTGKAGVGLVVGQNGVIVMEHADAYCPTPLVWYGNIGNNWTLVTVTISGNGAPHLYINGDFIKKGMASSKTKFVGAADWSLSDAYPGEYQGYYWGSVIGNGVTVDYSHCPYYGLMDDFRIYNRALSASEIKLLYKGEVAQLHTVKFDANNGGGIMEDEMVMAGADLSLPPNKFHNDGFVFQGWALSSSGDVAYKDEASITVNSDMMLYAVWTPIQIVVHFNANGGVFNGKDGNVTQYDQYFTYGEPQRLFTDDLTPVKSDEYGVHEFLGWVRDTPVINSSDDLIDGRAERTLYNDVTEVTYYAVWTTTVTVCFYNQGDKSLSPSSLADHLSWKIDDGSSGGMKSRKSGESIEVCPGYRTMMFRVDDEYSWIVGQINPEGYYSYDEEQRAMTIYISNDFIDPFFHKCAAVNVNVEVQPPLETDYVRFDCVHEIRESLRDRIKESDVPFDESKVRITIGRTGYNEYGNLEPMSSTGLTGLEPNENYHIPVGIYYIKDVTYDVDKASGNPYWGPVLESNFENMTFEVKDGQTTEVIIWFDMFGGDNAIRVAFDHGEGECAKSEMWFTKPRDSYVYDGTYRINKALPEPKKNGHDFTGWFTAKSGGRQIKEGSFLRGDCTLYARWTTMKEEWVYLFPELAARYNGNIAEVANLTAANGCRTVAECYALGINPEDPNDDLRIAEFKMENGKPVIKLNHTKDGSGNSFADRVRTLGKEKLTDAEWKEVPENGKPGFRFFTIGVDTP